MGGVFWFVLPCVARVHLAVHARVFLVCLAVCCWLSLAQQLFVMTFREELLRRQFPGDHARLDVVLEFLASQDIECVRELAGVYCQALVFRVCVSVCVVWPAQVYRRCGR